MQTVTIDPAFNGPPTSANGGYSCGVVAELVDGVAEVTLRKPPPLGVAMSVRREADRVLVERNGDLIAEARPSTIDLAIPEPVPFEVAERASGSYPGFRKHAFPTCFVCGPDRAAGDGLRIFVGAVDGRSVSAGPWVPSGRAVAGDGLVHPAVMWAALDCPSLFGAGGIDARQGIPVLGRLAARVERRVAAGERCVAMGWPLGRDGRKIEAAAAVYGEDGRIAGVSRATWIRLNPAAIVRPAPPAHPAPR